MVSEKYTLAYVKAYAEAFAAEFDEKYEQLLSSGANVGIARDEACKAAHIWAKSIADNNT
jgi:hypothetical protein